MPQLVSIVQGTLLNGFELPAARLVLITEKDIFGRQKKKLLTRKEQGEKISHFSDIKVGDYVVHVNHGIGKYLGVETLDVGGVHKDYLHIKYGGDDKLFVPTDQVQLQQKKRPNLTLYWLPLVTLRWLLSRLLRTFWVWV